MKDLISIDQLSLQDINDIHASAEKFFKNNIVILDAQRRGSLEFGSGR